MFAIQLYTIPPSSICIYVVHIASVKYFCSDLLVWVGAVYMAMFVFMFYVMVQNKQWHVAESNETKLILRLIALTC